MRGRKWVFGRWERKSNRNRTGDGERGMMNEWYGVSTGGKRELGQLMHVVCIITRTIHTYVHDCLLRSSATHCPSAAALPTYLVTLRRTHSL